MRRCTLAIALLSALAMAGNAGAVDINWVGGTGTWYLGDNWDKGGVVANALNTLGRGNGWENGNAVTPVDPDVIIGAGGNVLFDGGVAGDFRFRQQAAANGGSLTIKDGGKLELRASVAEDGEWIQFDADSITVTGPGSQLNRTNVGTAANGGAFVFGSWRSYNGQVIDLNVLNRAKFTGKGQLWFGAYNDSRVIDVGLTIGEGAQVSYAGALEGGVSLDNSAGEGNEADIDLIYNFDDTTAAPQANTYTIDFTGHGAALTVSETGIRVQTETAQDTWLSELVSYQDLNTKGILKQNGSAVSGLFGNSFHVTGSPGTAGYRIASIQGAAEGGAFSSDINGDLFVDGSDAGILIANFGATGNNAVLASGNIHVDAGGQGVQVIDGADAGNLIADFNSAYDPGPAAPGTAVAEYNKATGKIVVSVANVSNWYVESLSGGLTGPDSAAGALPAGGGLYAGNALRAGELSFGGSMTYADVNLGRIAAPGLSDLTVWYNGAGTGQPLQRGVIEIVPEPASMLLIGLSIAGIAAVRRRAA